VSLPAIAVAVRIRPAIFAFVLDFTVVGLAVAPTLPAFYEVHPAAAAPPWIRRVYVVTVADVEITVSVVVSITRSVVSVTVTDSWERRANSVAVSIGVAIAVTAVDCDPATPKKYEGEPNEKGNETLHFSNLGFQARRVSSKTVFKQESGRAARKVASPRG
jgi:hypothetical protein